MKFSKHFLMIGIGFCMDHGTFAAAMLVEDSVEIGIVLLPNPEVTAVAKGLTGQIKEAADRAESPYRSCPNIPHLSLFQLNVSLENLEALKVKLHAIAMGHTPMEFLMDEFLTHHPVNIFWSSKEAKDNVHLKELLNAVIEDIRPLRHAQPMRQIRDIPTDSLTEHQCHLIAEYGAPWGGQDNFNPHITLVYGTGPSEKAQTLVEDICPKDPATSKGYKFEASRLAVCKLGYVGNIEERLVTFDLA